MNVRKKIQVIKIGKPANTIRIPPQIDFFLTFLFLFFAGVLRLRILP